MTVVSIRAETDVTGNQKIGESLSQPLYSQDNQIRVHSERSDRVLVE